ncbi:MAG: septal ring lytic transglycosylase RlpA family protein, partial [Gammaproteobacteria bacterium]
MDNQTKYAWCLRTFLFFFLIILLNSCSHTHKRDGAPDFYVDETKIPNAVPKVEPLAKIGNQPSYRVFGKRYYTLKSSKNYDEVGTASWYGTAFHAQRTSSGERYNMLSMTAAHKTLPLPTYVEVTNLNNNRKVIVKVNDRGPFMGNRLIDLSYVAAKKLGMLGHGTALVRVKAIDPTAYNKPSFVYLQVGAFRHRSNAEKLQQHLVVMLDTPVKISKGKLYQVKVGPIKDAATVNK